MHPRQAVQTENPKLGTIHASPGGRECTVRRFFFRTQNQHKINVLPGGDSSPAKQFREKFQKRRSSSINRVQLSNAHAKPMPNHHTNSCFLPTNTIQSLSHKKHG